MKRSVVAGIAASAVIAGAGLIAANPTAPSLPDVQVPAIQLYSSEGDGDSTALWLDLLNQASGGNVDSFGANVPENGPFTVPTQPPLVVIDPQNSTEDFDGILDGIVGRMGSPLDAVNSAINGPDAVTYLIRNNGS